MDFYLKFASEEEARSVLYTVTPAVYEEYEDGSPTDTILVEEQVKPNYMNIDVLGVLYEKQEIVDPENPPTPIPYDGWFVNVRVIDEDATDLEPFRVDPEPTTPIRIWA